MICKAREGLGPCFCKQHPFRAEFTKLVNGMYTTDEFESTWPCLLERYNLTGNKFLTQIFENRKRWAKPYFAGEFCAGKTSTQRSECANHLLKKLISKNAPMHLFVSQYSKLLADRDAQEDREVHVTKQASEFHSFDTKFFTSQSLCLINAFLFFSLCHPQYISYRHHACAAQATYLSSTRCRSTREQSSHCSLRKHGSQGCFT